MGSLVSASNISFLLVFIEGIVSFFSPCIIPIIPVYMSYLAGNPDRNKEDGKVRYNRKSVFFYTLIFVLGISFAFFILAMAFTVVGSFFQRHQLLFTRIGGILIVFLGLFQLGFIDFSFLNRERKIRLNLNKKKITPFIAFILGFTFSFAWTPCVGPALSSVLILASSAKSSFMGYILVLIYTLGFIIPFLLLGLFTTQALNFLDKNQNFIKYTVKIGGVILILIGFMTFTGWLNNISRYLNSFVPGTTAENNTQERLVEEDLDENEKLTGNEEKPIDKEGNEKTFPAFDFTLVDQYGDEHTLSDYKGKVVFLNFWATWCPPCREEMPDIEALYNKYDKNQGDVIILGISSPKTSENIYTREVEKEGVIDYLKDNDIIFPVVFDETGSVYSTYSISALPTSFFIDKEGNIYGYAPGRITKDIMINTIEKLIGVN